MTRALRVVPSGDARGVLAALRDALSGDGPAILPHPGSPAFALDGAGDPNRSSRVDRDSQASRSSGVDCESQASRPGQADRPGQTDHARQADRQSRVDRTRHPNRPATPAPLPTTVAKRVAVVVETSGSTGAPKRVALSADALLASAAASEVAIGGPGQWLLALPANYIAGINVLVRSLTAQTEPVILDPAGFTAARFVAAAATMTEPSRFVSLVPAQLSRLVDDEQATAALRRFDRILLGGQAAPRPLLERAAELGIAVTRTYGSSETSGGCVYDGSPIGNTEVRIENGRVELGGSMLAEEYLGDADATASAFFEENSKRWYRTDDLGELVDGVLRVTGRVDDVVVSGGVKVSLAAVEATVRRLSGLGDAVVVAAPSPEWGEVPVVVTTANVELEAVRSAVAEVLDRAAAPARLIVVDELPMLDSGKPDRVALSRLALQ